MKKTIPFMLCVLAIASIASISVLGNTQTAYAGVGGFSGTFDPSNWTEFTEGNGFVDTTGAPASISVIGSDESIDCLGFFPFSLPSNLLRPEQHDILNCVTDFTITIPCDGTVDFDWSSVNSQESNVFDVPGFLVNGVFTVLNHAGTDSGSQGVPVQLGDVFGFRVDATDDVSGFGVLDITNFDGPQCVVGGEFLPIDSTALVLAGLQTSAIWMLPVLAGVAGSAFGILYIKSRRN